MVDRHDPTRLVLDRLPLEPAVLATEHAAEKVFLDGRRCTAQDLRALAALPSARVLQISGLRSGLGELAAERGRSISSLAAAAPETVERPAALLQAIEAAAGGNDAPRASDRARQFHDLV